MGLNISFKMKYAQTAVKAGSRVAIKLDDVGER
jgi:hypothetical protein